MVRVEHWLEMCFWEVDHLLLLDTFGIICQGAAIEGNDADVLQQCLDTAGPQRVTFQLVGHRFSRRVPRPRSTRFQLKNWRKEITGGGESHRVRWIQQYWQFFFCKLFHFRDVYRDNGMGNNFSNWFNNCVIFDSQYPFCRDTVRYTQLGGLCNAVHPGSGSLSLKLPRRIISRRDLGKSSQKCQFK